MAEASGTAASKGAKASGETEPFRPEEEAREFVNANSSPAHKKIADGNPSDANDQEKQRVNSSDAQAERGEVDPAREEAEEAQRNSTAKAADDSESSKWFLYRPNPWAEPVSGSELFDEISVELRRRAAFPPGGAEAATLWAVHTHAVAAPS